MPSTLSELRSRLDSCLQKDRPNLRRRLRELDARLKQGKPSDRMHEELETAIGHSLDGYRRRLATLPRPAFDDFLPVNQRLDEIRTAIQQHQVVIVCGETGSGKTTQLPKICLDLGRGVAGLIGHTQPRRIAARSVASRIAQELSSPLGEAVGYKVRFNDKISERNHIKLMTDGILLAETQGDRFLNAYDTIIIDEAHERSLNIDFLLGYLKQLLPRRPDLKVIVTSATIDAERFSQHFNGAPVIEVSGRTYPVEVRYRALQTKDEDDREEDMEEAIVDAVDELMREGGGDILVFLPGEREIRDTAEHLRKHAMRGVEVLPLFARLSVEDQQRIFKPSGARRIVLATNVAETSLTVPGIRYVIDTGLARINRYSPRGKVTQLQIEKISQASARQRAGRCGRVAEGICVRLYDEDDFNARPPFSDPEILRSSLANVILRMEALKLGEVEAFPFIEPPSSRQIADGYQLLQELGAVDEQRRLTPLGSELAKLPVDPKIGRMLIAGRDEHCLAEILTIASGLSIQDPRERPYEAREAVDRAQARFADERSDFLAYLKLWDFFDEAFKHKKSNKQLINLCHEHFLSHLRLREWRELHAQLAGIVADMGYRLNDKPATYEQLHKALLSGLLGNLGMKQQEDEQYLGARGIKFSIFPGSGLKKSRPKWVLTAELVETTKLYARCVAKIEPEWVEPVAGSLCKSHYYEPHWEKDRGEVVAWERVTLYGLPIVPRRNVSYGRINPQEARELFIREGLATFQLITRGGFYQHNQHLIRDIEQLEHKARRPDVLVDDEQIFAFYDALIPADICTAAGFEAWREQAEKQQPKLLWMTREALMRHGANQVTADLYPEAMDINGVRLPLRYRFEPGHALDGVTISVPLALLNQLEPEQFDWLVPGMLREKLASLIKSLPKAIRRNCVPVPDFVTAAMTSMKIGDGPLLDAFGAYVQQRTGQSVVHGDWNLAELSPHSFMNYRIVDDARNELAMGRDLNALKAQLGQAAQLTFRDNAPSIEREGITKWDVGDLPEKITFNKGKQQLTGYPALEDNGESVAIRLFDTELEAQAAMRAGVRRLMRLELKEQMKQLEKSLPNFTQIAMQLRAVANADDLRDDVLLAITDRAFIGDEDLPRNDKAFTELRQKAKTRLPAVTQGAMQLLGQIATEYQQNVLKLAGNQKPMAELREQMQRLVYKGFFHATPWAQLAHLPRYLKALRVRLEKYANAQARDQQRSAEVNELWARYLQRQERNRKNGVDQPKLEDFRWLIEELRVSLFAQELKTPFPVSLKRLNKFWDDELGR
ncbi:ATP-dependent RNA helicase HrpA [Chitinivorax sp. PXF-14]|uniref:ATP-dependent RNA helicase HrpA n=1 Tax=Chitinivorax sp. PXF-14 TaxID=3230488 RepID=UPI0034655CBC